MTSRHPIRSSLLLLLTALIWGFAFVAQRSGMAFIGPFLFIALRMVLGAATLLVVLCVGKLFSRRRVFAGAGDVGGGARGGDAAKLAERQLATEATIDSPAVAGKLRVATDDARAAGEKNGLKQNRAATGGTEAATSGELKGRHLLIAGLVCGIVLFASSSFQQIGLVDVEAGKAGFLTALYIVLVPILGIVLRHKTHWNAWLSVVIAVAGLYFLCIKEGQAIQPGDLITLIGALGWACHILVIDHFVEHLSQRGVLQLCVAQFAVAGLLALLVFPFFDQIFVSVPLSLEALLDAAPSFLYVGILSTGVAFSLQAVGQQGLAPTAASLIMSLESVFAVVGGMLLLQEMMELREFLGCALMFAAVVLSQLPVGQKPDKCG